MTGRNDELPINAWAAIIDPTDPDVDLDVIVSEDLDRRETLTQFSENKKARVVVNGGYFFMEKKPPENVGLLYVNNRTERRPQDLYYATTNVITPPAAH